MSFVPTAEWNSFMWLHNMTFINYEQLTAWNLFHYNKNCIKVVLCHYVSIWLLVYSIAPTFPLSGPSSYKFYENQLHSQSNNVLGPRTLVFAPALCRGIIGNTSVFIDILHFCSFWHRPCFEFFSTRFGAVRGYGRRRKCETLH